MEGGEPVEVKPRESVWPGLLLALALACGGYGIAMGGAGIGWSGANLLDPVLLGMLLGLAWGNLAGRSLFLPGMSLTVRRLLPIGIVLLGARMDFVDALRVGLPGLALSVGIVLLALGLLWILGRRLGLDRDLACLLGVGTGICGGTAIVAIAPLLRARERDILVGVGLVTLIGLASMLLLPSLAGLLGFSETQFGLLAGLTIHQTPQVIAAGFAFGDEAGQVATVAKLARVCLLAPVAVAIGWWVARESRSGDGETGSEPPGGQVSGIRRGARRHAGRRPWYRLLPGFALGFLVMAGARTLGLLPEVGMEWQGGLFGDGSSLSIDTASLLKSSSSFLLATGMVGVGFQTRLSQGREIGWRPVIAAVAASVLITLVVATILKLFFS